MTSDIQSGVRKRLESPTEGKTVTLIVGVTDSESDAIVGTVEDTGAEVEKRIPHDYLAVAINEEDLEALCDLDVVTSVSIEGKSTTLDSENFHSPNGSVL